MKALANHAIVLAGGPREVVMTAAGVVLVTPGLVGALQRYDGAIDLDWLSGELGLVGESARQHLALALMELRDIGVTDVHYGTTSPEITQVDLAWGSFAMLPRQVAALAREVLTGRCHVAVEFGSGASTVAMAAAMSLTGERCKLLSFEQDEAWAAAIDRPLDQVRHPLVEVHLGTPPLRPWAGQATLPVERWYDVEQVTGELARLPGPVELLVVDGPTAYQEQWQYDRYPALPVSAPFLAADATVVLDDTQRASEQRVLQEWLGELGPGWQSAATGRGTWLRRVH